MSIIDKVREKLGHHSEKAEQGVERAADMADEKTGGKHSRTIGQAEEKAKQVVDKQADEKSE